MYLKTMPSILLVTRYFSLILISLSISNYAQPGFRELEFLATDISPDGHFLTGSGSGGVPVIWSESTGFIPIGNQIAAASGIASNGNAIAGTLGNEAFVWSSTGGITMLGFLPGGNVSQSAGITDDGSVVVGFSTSSFAPAGEGFIWTAATGMTGVGDLPGGQIYSFANGVSGDGNVVVGWSRSTDNFGEAFRWSGGVLEGLGKISGYTSSAAYAASYDGSVIVGQSSNGTTIMATMWTDGAVINLGGAGVIRSQAFDVSADGQVVVGLTQNGADPFEAAIWDSTNGLRNLKQVLENDYGLDLSGWTLSIARRVSADGKVILGNGINPQGNSVAWRAVLRNAPLQINNPLGNTTYIADGEITIEWTANGVDSVAIYFSADATDSVATLSQVEASWPADVGSYSWILPDTISRKCIIIVEDVSNPAVNAVSDTFRIKPYILTRVDANGDYEPFSIAQDAWQFDNRGNNLWPQSWWQQFDYATADDPNTGVGYPPAFPAWPIYARAAEFPDWPLLTDAYGLLECYWSLPNASYSPAALLFWKNTKGSWGGSCFGFSATSLIAFGNRDEFYNLFPFIANFNDLRSLTADEEERKAINQLFIGQYGERFRAHLRAKWEQPPSQTLTELQSMLLDDVRDDRFLLLISNDPSDPGAHAVVPYKVEAHESLPDRYWIYVYDNNAPNDFTLRFLINTDVDIWSYSQYPNWGGSRGLFLSNPMSDYFSDFNIGKTASKGGESNFKIAGNGLIDIHQSTGMNINIRNSAGESVGYIDSVLVNEIPAALPIIPITGYPHPPIGFELPAADYSITLDNFQDTNAYVSINNDSLLYHYSRSNAINGQRDQLSFNEGLSFANSDAVTKTVELQTIMVEASRERVVDITDLAIGQNDSMITNFTATGEYKLRNFGDDSSYDLRLELVSATENPVFIHNDIVLPPNSSHILQPDWNDLLSQPLQILIDTGNDGTIDDSMTVVHQPVAIDENFPGIANLPQEFELAQNYPNPFNPATRITFSLPKAAEISLAVYNVLGQQIVTLARGKYAAGHHTVSFDGAGLGSGVYLYRLEAEGVVKVRKMLLIK